MTKRESWSDEVEVGDADEDPEVARSRHAASLFANITRVTWAPECGDGVVAGVVAYDDGHTARRFSINETDRFRVCDALWEMLDSPHMGTSY